MVQLTRSFSIGLGPWRVRQGSAGRWTCIAALWGVGCAGAGEAQRPAANESQRPASTHTGLISIQEASIPALPAAGHGLSVRIDLNQVTRAPDFEEVPGQLAGCRAWLYDMAQDPPPSASGDEGRITISGTEEPVPQGCVFEPGGYVCPAGRLDLRGAHVTPNQDGTALFDMPSAVVSEELASGRYFRQDSASPSNARFPVLAIPSKSSLLLHAPGLQAADIREGSATLLAGAGPVPNNPRNPLLGGEQVTVGLEANPTGNFSFDAVTLKAGADFRPDAPTLELLESFPVEPRAQILSCAGLDGECGEAQASAVSITTTDADISGLPALAFPLAVRKQVFVLCGVLGGDGSVVVPVGVMQLIERAHQESAITRIRVAYMRDGLVTVENPPPAPANPITILVGHQKVGLARPALQLTAP
jgi:hypothetical protein